MMGVVIMKEINEIFNAKACWEILGLFGLYVLVMVILFYITYSVSMESYNRDHSNHYYIYEQV